MANLQTSRQGDANSILLWIACMMTVVAFSSVVVAFVAMRLETRANEIEKQINKQVRDVEKAFGAMDFQDSPKQVKPKR